MATLKWPARPMCEEVHSIYSPRWKPLAPETGGSPDCAFSDSHLARRDRAAVPLLRFAVRAIPTATMSREFNQGLMVGGTVRTGLCQSIGSTAWTAEDGSTTHTIGGLRPDEAFVFQPLGEQA